MDNSHTLNYYETNAKSLSIRYESADIKNIHEQLVNTFPANSYLLEIGCGSGRDASFMHKNGYDVLATDGSREMITEAKNLHPELAKNLQTIKVPGDLNNLKTASFDGVYSIATLMHLEKTTIDHTIKKITTLLKVGGKFFFSVSIKRDDINHHGKDQKGRHFTTLTTGEWIDLCEKYDLQLVYKEVSGDGLNREGITWLTCVMVKNGK